MWKLIRYRLSAPRPTRALEDMAGTHPSPAPSTPIEQGPSHDLLKQWHTRVSGAFGGSLHVRHVDTGSCNACEWELTALLNPVYDVQRLGIDFVASPRHADVLVVTGGLTRNLAEALRMTYEATAHPKAVVALGECACGQGLVGATYAQAGGVAPEVPILVTVPGCPPHPHQILRGLLEAMSYLDGGGNTSEHGASAV